MTFILTENDLEDYLFGHPEALRTFSGNKVSGWIARQFRVPSGIIDLLGYVKVGENRNWPVVVELKSVPMTASALTQVCRYSRDVYNVLVQRNDYYVQYPETIIYKMVIAPSEGPSNELIYEANALNVSLYTFEPKFDLKIGGPWRFTREKNEDDRNTIGEISRNPLFSMFDLVEDESDKTEGE